MCCGQHIVRTMLLIMMEEPGFEPQTLTSYLSHLTPLPSRPQLNVGKGIPIYGLLKVRLVSCFNPLAFTLIIANSIRIILKQYIFVTNILYLYTNTKLVFYPITKSGILVPMYKINCVFVLVCIRI